MKQPELGRLLNNALQNTYRHQLVVARLYRALAERQSNESHQEVLLVLAQSSEDKATGCAKRLQRLGVSPPLVCDSLGDRIWRWLLVRGGVTWVMAWITWIEGGDFHLYSRLIAAISPLVSHSDS